MNEPRTPDSDQNTDRGPTGTPAEPAASPAQADDGSQAGTAPWTPAARPPLTPGGLPPRQQVNGTAWIVAGVAVLVVLGVLGTLLLGGVGRPVADTALGWAADDLSEWDAITYRGTVTRSGVTDVGIDLTVDGRGDVAGTLTRAGGGRADYARIGGVELVKADAAWWRSDPEGARKAQRLAGVWLRNPSQQIDTIASSSLLSPSALADDLDEESSRSAYDDAGPEAVDGVNGRAIESLGRRIVLTEGSSPRLLSMQSTFPPSRSPVRVSRPGPAALAAVDTARTAAATATDYTATLSEKPNVVLAWEPALPALCTTEICTAVARVTNTSPFDADGTLTVSLNGRTEGTHPFRLGPGRSATFTTEAGNPGIDSPNVTVSMRWTADIRTY